NFRLTVDGNPVVDVRGLNGALIVGSDGVAASFETDTFPTFALPGIHIGPMSTTTTADVDSSVTTIPVTSADGFPASGEFKIKIGGEVMLVTGGQGTTSWTVTRGFDGTTAADHTSGDTVELESLFKLQINTGSAAVDESIDVDVEG